MSKCLSESKFWAFGSPKAEKTRGAIMAPPCGYVIPDPMWNRVKVTRSQVLLQCNCLASRIREKDFKAKHINGLFWTLMMQKYEITNFFHKDKKNKYVRTHNFPPWMPQTQRERLGLLEATLKSVIQNSFHFCVFSLSTLTYAGLTFCMNCSANFWVQNSALI